MLHYMICAQRRANSLETGAQNGRWNSQSREADVNALHSPDDAFWNSRTSLVCGNQGLRGPQACVSLRYLP